MSQDLLTELEEGLDTDVIESINDTFEAEDEYNDYIQKERQKRKKEQELKRRKQLREAKKNQDKQIEKYQNESEKSLNKELDDNRIDIDTQITKYTARIHKIKKLKNRNIFLIYLKERDNTVTKQRIEIGLPEDKSNEWVRLCEWFDVNPSKPTELPESRRESRRSRRA